MLEMIAENSGAPRRRSGRKAIQSSATLSRPADEARAQQRDDERRVQPRYRIAARRTRPT